MHTNIHTNFNETNERSSVYLNFYQEYLNHLLRASEVVIADTAVVMDSVA